jgi:hypothetical protein
MLKEVLKMAEVSAVELSGLKRRGWPEISALRYLA